MDTFEYRKLKEEIEHMSDNNLFKRKGILIVSRQLILEANEQKLKEIFTHFFPIDADRYHQCNYWDSIKYYGVSPHFEEIEEACIAPEYEMILKSDEEGNFKFEKFKKRIYPVWEDNMNK